MDWGPRLDSILAAVATPSVDASQLRGLEQVGLLAMLTLIFWVLRFEARRGAFLLFSSWSWGLLTLAAGIEAFEFLVGRMPHAIGGVHWPALAVAGCRLAHLVLLVCALLSTQRAIAWSLAAASAVAAAGVGVGLVGVMSVVGVDAPKGIALLELPGYLGLAGVLFYGMHWHRGLGWRLALAGSLGHALGSGLATGLTSLVSSGRGSPVWELMELASHGFLGSGCILVFTEEMRRELASAHARLEILVDKLQRERNLDALTGTFNRLAFEEKIGFEAAGITSGTIAVFDLDDLKWVNDRFGHDAGDQIVRAFADGLRRRLRPTDLIYRLGGDEFAVIFERTRSQQVETRLAAIVESLQAVRLETTRPPEIILPIQVSFGVAEFANLEGLPSALRQADRRMYEMKRRRKGTGERGFVKEGPGEDA